MGQESRLQRVCKRLRGIQQRRGGFIDIGIEDDKTLPPENQKIPEGLATEIVNKISGKTQGVVLSADVLVADNGGEYIKLHVLRNANAPSATTSGKFFLRIGDNSVPVGPEDISRLAEDKGCISWEDTET